jgi:hypothetical protein
LREVNATVEAAIAAGILKVAELFILELADGTIHRYTTAAKDMTWDSGNNIYSTKVIHRTPIQFSSNLESDRVNIAIGNIEGGLYDKIQNNILESCKVTIKRVLWSDTYAADKEILLFVGYADIEFDRQVLTLNCRPLEDSLNVTIPRHTFQEPCNYSLFEDGCTLVQNDYKIEGTATGGTRNTMIQTGRGSLYKVPFDAGDESNPIEIGDTLEGERGVGNDFSADSDCMALWNFEPSALVDDDKGGNDLTNNGADEETDDYKRGSGAAAFVRASTDYMERADADLDTNFPLKSGESNKIISITAWVKFYAFGASTYHSPIFTKWNRGTGERSISLSAYNSAGTARIWGRVGTGATHESYECSAIDLVIDIWYHVAFTYNDTTKDWRIRVWDDSARVAYENTGTGSVAIAINNEPAKLGHLVGIGNYYLDGILDEVAVFKDELSQADIDNIRKGLYGGVASNSAKCINIIYSTATTGYIWFNNMSSGFVFEDNEVVSDNGDSITINGTPVINTNYYIQGELKITSGDNSGCRRPILSDIAGVVTVIWPFPNVIANGNTYEIYPGCEKTITTCQDRFNNIENFRGFTHIPKWEETAF